MWCCEGDSCLPHLADDEGRDSEGVTLPVNGWFSGQPTHTHTHRVDPRRDALHETFMCSG